MPSRGRLFACALGSLLALSTVPACSTTLNVVEVYMGLDSPGEHGETRRRDVFFTDTREIHCITKVGVGRPDATIQGRIHQVRSYDFGAREFGPADIYFAADEVNPDVSKGPVFIDMVVRTSGANGEQGPYPPGSFVCEIFADGEYAGSARFNVDFPPCPSALITSDTACAGFYETDTVCSRNGESSNDASTCTCTQDGWKC